MVATVDCRVLRSFTEVKAYPERRLEPYKYVGTIPVEEKHLLFDYVHGKLYKFAAVKANEEPRRIDPNENNKEEGTFKSAYNTWCV